MLRFKNCNIGLKALESGGYQIGRFFLVEKLHQRVSATNGATPFSLKHFLKYCYPYLAPS